jgi:hypothetical protein
MKRFAVLLAGIGAVVTMWLVLAAGPAGAIVTCDPQVQDCSGGSLFEQLNNDLVNVFPPVPQRVALPMATRAENAYPPAPIFPPNPCAAFQPFELSYNGFGALANFTAGQANAGKITPGDAGTIQNDIDNIQGLLFPPQPNAPACTG